MQYECGSKKYKILSGISEGRTELRRDKQAWEDNIKTD
jgi:hypothetical protein